MQSNLRIVGVVLAVVVIGAIIAVLRPARLKHKLEDEHEKAARLQVNRIADTLDKRTNSSGVYERVKPGEINEVDPWGQPIDISYSQGGIAELVHVRSGGPDRQLQTDDDVYAQRMAANMKGVGEGIKENAGEVAENAAKGAVKGAITGVKEAIRESLPKKKKSATEGVATDAPPGD